MGHQHSSIHDNSRTFDPIRPSYCERLRRKIRPEKEGQADATPEEHEDIVSGKGLVVSVQAARLEASTAATSPNQDSLKQNETPARAQPTTNAISLASASIPTPTMYECAVRPSLSQSASPLITKMGPCRTFSDIPSAVEDTRNETDWEDNMKRLSMTLSRLEYNLQHWDEYAASGSEPRTKDQSPSAKVHLGSRVLNPSETPDTAQVQHYYRMRPDLASNNPYRAITQGKEQGSERVPSSSTISQQVKPSKPMAPKVPALKEDTKTEQTSNTANDKEKRPPKQPLTSITTTTPPAQETDAIVLEHLSVQGNNGIGESVLKAPNSFHPALRSTQREQSDKCNNTSELAAQLPNRSSGSIISTQREQAKAEASTAEATILAGTAQAVEAVEAAKIAGAAAEAEARLEQEKYDYGMSLLLQEQEERQRASSSQPSFRECTVCCHSLHPLSFPASPPSSQCTHKSQTCNTCLHKWISSQMQRKGWKNICCPQCIRLLSHSDVRRASDEKTFDRYDRFSMMEAVGAMSNFAWCLRPGCSSGQENRLGVAYMVCAACKYQQCLRHRMAWHKGMTCSQYDEQTRAKTMKLVRDNENLSSERFIEHNTKACPNCEAAIEKSYGCDHMTCSKCRQEFCYRCLVKYEDIRKGGSLAHARQCKFH